MDIAIGRWNELFRYPAIELFEIAEVEKQIHAHEFESTFHERVGFQKSNIKKNKNILLNVIIVLLSSLHFYRWTFFIIYILIYINIYNPFGFRYILLHFLLFYCVEHFNRSIFIRQSRYFDFTDPVLNFCKCFKIGDFWLHYILTNLPSISKQIAHILPRGTGFLSNISAYSIKARINEDSSKTIIILPPCTTPSVVQRG